MTPTIHQSIRFPARARDLYRLYMDPKRHAAFTGSRVVISPKPGSKFSAFDSMLSGHMLFTLAGQLIVQRWRGHHWRTSDPDSILILQFTQEGKEGRIDLAHINVPQHDHAGVTTGWKKYCWKPMRSFLKRSAVSS